MNVQEFIEKHKLLYHVERVRFRPDGNLIDLPFHYRFTILRDGESYTGYYSMGSAHKGKPPELNDVLESVASDVTAVIDCTDWAEFLIELGYTENAQSIRQGYSAWTGCWMTKNGIERVIGKDGLEQFLDIDWDYEYEITEMEQKNVE